MDIVDDTHFRCRSCGDTISVKNLSREEVEALDEKLKNNGCCCDDCVGGITTFEKRAKYEVLQWVGNHGLVPMETIFKVFEPQAKSRVEVQLQDGRIGRIERGTGRRLREEVDLVMRALFPKAQLRKR